MATLSEKNKCRQCGTELALDSHPRTKYCSVKCRSKSYYDRTPSYREAVSKRTSARVVKKRNEQLELVNKIKTESGCARCGYSKHPVALQFNHIDPKEKSFSISQKLGKVDWETIQKEIDKCEVLCANCHSIHSYETHYRKCT